MYSHYVTENIQLTTYQIIFKVAIFGRKTNFLKFEFHSINKPKDNSKAYGIFEFTRSRTGVIRTKTPLTGREPEATATQRRTKDPWNWE